MFVKTQNVRVKANITYGPQLIMLSHGLRIFNCKKCTTGMQDVTVGKIVKGEGQMATLYFLPNFSRNLKLRQKLKYIC